ncbi:MAG: Peptidase M50B-like protein [Fibrobacteres bacterium]|nr:Peptidase M50B-like protein [Fibrobacterota bacterium]
MPRLVGMVFRWTLLPFLLLLAQAMASELFRALRASGLGPAAFFHPLALWFAAGIGFRILFGSLMRRMGRDDPLEFIDTLEHELTHALVGYATLCPPVSLSASLKSGGEVELKGHNPLAVLAPYFLPLWCLLILLLGLVVKPGMQNAWDHLLFFLMGWFCYRLFREYGWRQTDLHLYGFVFSAVSVFILLLADLGLILHVRGLLSAGWMGASGRHAWHALPLAWGWILDRLAVQASVR